MSDVKAKVYYNPSYQGCNDKPCYLIHIRNGGTYVTTINDSFKILDDFIPELNENTIDTYVESRGFYKVLERMDDGHIVYYNNFDSPEKREDMSRHMGTFIAYVNRTMKYSLSGFKYISTIYGIANSIESQTWKHK